MCPKQQIFNLYNLSKENINHPLPKKEKKIQKGHVRIFAECSIYIFSQKKNEEHYFNSGQNIGF